MNRKLKNSNGSPGRARTADLVINSNLPDGVSESPAPGQMAIGILAKHSPATSDEPAGVVPGSRSATLSATQEKPLGQEL